MRNLDLAGLILSAHDAAVMAHELDFIVSQNFEHIVKDKAIRLAAMVNEAEGYKRTASTIWGRF